MQLDNEAGKWTEREKYWYEVWRSTSVQGAKDGLWKIAADDKLTQAKTLLAVLEGYAPDGIVGKFSSLLSSRDHTAQIRGVLDQNFPKLAYANQSDAKAWFDDREEAKRKTTEQKKDPRFILGLIKEALGNEQLDPNSNLAGLLKAVKRWTGVDYEALPPTQRGENVQDYLGRLSVGANIPPENKPARSEEKEEPSGPSMK